MKNILFNLVLFILTSCSSTPTGSDAIVHFNDLDYNFASISYMENAEHNFEFINTGGYPLVIYDVKTSCGCTVPEWTKKPIKPGGTGEIKIKYDADFPGVFHKTIKVYYNGKVV